MVKVKTDIKEQIHQIYNKHRWPHQEYNAIETKNGEVTFLCGYEGNVIKTVWTHPDKRGTGFTQKCLRETIEQQGLTKIWMPNNAMLKCLAKMPDIQLETIYTVVDGEFDNLIPINLYEKNHMTVLTGPRINPNNKNLEFVD